MGGKLGKYCSKFRTSIIFILKISADKNNRRNISMSILNIIYIIINKKNYCIYQA